MKPKEVECLECGGFFPNLDAWQLHLKTCVPLTATMTTAEIDAAYERALKPEYKSALRAGMEGFPVSEHPKVTDPVGATLDDVEAKAQPSPHDPDDLVAKHITSRWPTEVCPRCGGKWSVRSERAFHPDPDDGIRVAWACVNEHVYYGGEKWLRPVKRDGDYDDLEGDLTGWMGGE